MKMRIIVCLQILGSCFALTSSFQFSSPLRNLEKTSTTELYDYRRDNRRTERYFPNDYDARPSVTNVDGYDRTYENLNYGNNGQQRRYQEYRQDGPRPMGSNRLAYQGGGVPRNFDERNFMDAEWSRSGGGTRHLWIVISATCWWYLYASFGMVATPPKDFFFGLDKGSLQSWGGLMAMATLPLYASCTKLIRAESLLEAQISVLGIAAIGAPISAMISLLNPTHSYGWTAVGIAEVTMFLGVFVAHHLRQASYRERRGFPNINPQTSFEALTVYTPPRFYQSTMIGWDLTRSMIAFHVAISVIGQSLIQSKQTFGALFPFNDKLWPWVLIVLHMGHDCLITALYPGSKLRRYLSYALTDSALYGLQIYAALASPIMQKWLSGGGGGSHALLADQVLIVAFVTNAALQLLEPMSAIIRALDLDQRFGLTNFYNSGGYMNDFDQRYEQFYGNPGYGPYDQDRRY